MTDPTTQPSSPEESGDAHHPGDPTESTGDGLFAEPERTGADSELDTDDQFTGDDGHDPLDDDELRSALEAMLLVVDSPVTTGALATAVGEPDDRVEAALRALDADLTERSSGIDLRYAGDGWRFYTRTDYAPYVEKLLLDGVRSKLTRAALETLAVIAYRQPVTRARVSAVRGVNVDGVMRTLLARGLIREAGNDPETSGTMYCTTEMFLERLGLASLSELPDLAPLLPDVDVIDDIDEEIINDPRFAKMDSRQADSRIDLTTSELD